jgi:ElaB/YqjD/DUF883 family membrane-anchored ribosome-binding protein
MNRYPDIAESEGNGRSAGALAKGAKSAVAQASRKGKGELHNFISDVEDLITSMTPLTGADLERAKQKLTERVQAAKESLTEVSAEIAERARESARVTNTYVHEHPWQSVGIGAILGLLVGIAINRRM